jgi:hypothetical protein
MGRGQVLDPDGSVAHDTGWHLNSLADEGELSILTSYFLEGTNPDKFLGLLTADPSETDEMADVVEMSGSGYERIQIASGDWGAPALSSGDYRTTATEKAFGPATGGPWSIKHAFLTTALSGTAGLFLLWVPLSGPTTVGVGQSFRYTLAAKVQ